MLTFDGFLHELCPPLDLVWRRYRRRAARHRIDARMRQLGLDSYQSYLDRVRSDADEAAGIPDLMLVTVTRFFREQRAWRELRERVFPALATEPVHGNRIRAWSAGCCGGEEPYSMALCWLEYLHPLYPDRSLEVLATDIDGASLERAERGIYDTPSLRELPRELRDRWFLPAASRWRIRDEARALVTFQKKNLLRDAAPQDVDLVLCRYLAFTYYTGERLVAAARKLSLALRPGGVLMIGARETLAPATQELFEPMSGSRCFYRKKR